MRISDALSLRTLADLVARSDRNEHRESDSEAAQAPLEYADYAAWQLEEQLASSADRPVIEDVDSTRRYLRNPALSGQPHPFVIAPPWSADSVEVATRAIEQMGVDLVDFSLAAATILSARKFLGDHVTVGLTSDGRGADELAGALGPFAWTDRIRVEIDLDDTLSTVATRIRNSWSESPSPSVPTSDAAIAPLLAVDLVSENEMPEEYPSDFSSAMIVRAGRDGFAMWFDPRRITPDQAHVLTDAFGAIIFSATSANEDRVWELGLIDPREVPNEAPFDLVGPPATAPEQLVIRRFEEQTKRTPTRLALISDGDSLTYEQLDRRANGLAHELVAAGATAQRSVGIVLHRSIDQVVAILAAWKAGAPYVPINPDQPTGRVAAQLDYAQPAVVITADALGNPDAAPGRRTMALDSSLFDADLPPTAGISPDDAAYLIFTSGSTGEPKAVVVSHGNIANYVDAMVARFATLDDFDDGLTYAVVSSLSTDLGNTTLYPPLVAGGTVSLVPVHAAMDPDAFVAYQHDHPTDVMKITPSHLRMLLGAGASSPSRTITRLWRRVSALGSRGASLRAGTMQDFEPLRADRDHCGLSGVRGQFGDGVRAESSHCSHRSPPSEHQRTDRRSQAPASPARDRG